MLPIRALGRVLLQDPVSRWSISQPLTLTFSPPPFLAALVDPGGALQSHQQLRFKHRKISDLKVDFRWKRERPLGPHKHKPPNVVGAKSSLNYRNIIHYPEDGQYTIKKLDVTKLGGRHPETGRKVIEGVGGGSKQKARWIDWHRLPKDFPRDGSVLEERVISINYDPMRKAMIFLTGYEDKLRWQIATTNVKEGDIIRTYTEIPRNPIRPVVGDAHPIGALPLGTEVCLVESWPGEGARLALHAEQSSTILRKVKDRVVISSWTKQEFAVPEECLCVVGRVTIHPLKAMHIGSPNRMRWLGIRQRSGLWKRKDGYRGFKNRPAPPTCYTDPWDEYQADAGTPSNSFVGRRSLLCDALSEGQRGRIAKRKKKIKEGCQWYQPGHTGNNLPGIIS